MSLLLRRLLLLSAGYGGRRGAGRCLGGRGGRGASRQGAEVGLFAESACGREGRRCCWLELRLLQRLLLLSLLHGECDRTYQFARCCGEAGDPVSRRRSEVRHDAKGRGFLEINLEHPRREPADPRRAH